MNEKINVDEIAKKARVSRTTVRNALNGRTGKMKQETYEKIMGIIESTGYVRHIIPALLAQDVRRMVAVIVNGEAKITQESIKILSIITSLEQLLYQNNYHLIFHAHNINEKISLYSEAWELAGILLFDQVISENEFLYARGDILVRNMQQDEYNSWDENDIEKEISKFLKDLLALSRKCGKI